MEILYKKNLAYYNDNIVAYKRYLLSADTVREHECVRGQARHDRRLWRTNQDDRRSANRSPAAHAINNPNRSLMLGKSIHTQII